MTYVSGNAFQFIPEGTAGEVAVVTLGPVDSSFGSSRIPVVIRNNTESTVEGASVAIVARDSSNAMIAVAEASSMYPFRLPPGEIAFGEAYISNTILPPEVTFETLVTSDPEGAGCCGELLTVVSHSLLGERIVGELRNDSPEEAGYAIAQVMCFVGGQPYGTYSGSVVGDSLAPGASGAFQVDLYDACENYLIAGS
jgi:hypothetical protein